MPAPAPKPAAPALLGRGKRGAQLRVSGATWQTSGLRFRVQGFLKPDGFGFTVVPPPSNNLD